MNIEKMTPEFCEALATAQAEIENAEKKSENPHFKSRYADLAEILNTVRPVLSKHGFSVMQFPLFDGAQVHVQTLLAHKTGSVSCDVSCVPAKTDAQGVGACITYLRRYGLASICGISQEDDDGQSATHDSKPLSDDDKVIIDEWTLSINNCNSLDELKKVSKELAESKVSANIRTVLRKVGADRQEVLK